MNKTKGKCWMFRYNVYKGISTGITFLTPILTAVFIGDFWDSPARSMSTTACFSVLISTFFLKDKFAEGIKTPTAFVLASSVFGFCILARAIINSLQVVALTTMITCGVDELTFKRFYKNIEESNIGSSKKILGFMISTTPKIYNCSGGGNDL